MSNIRFEAIKRSMAHRVPESAGWCGEEEKVKDYFARDVFTRERMKEYIAEEVLAACTFLCFPTAMPLKVYS